MKNYLSLWELTISPTFLTSFCIMHSVAYDKKTQVYQDAHSHVNRLSFLLLLLPDICALANCLTYPNEKQTLFCTRGTMVEDSELGNLWQCTAQLQKVTALQQTKLFSVIVTKRVKTHNAIPKVKNTCGENDTKLLNSPFFPSSSLFQMKAEQG